jgi:hypothetical protein
MAIKVTVVSLSPVVFPDLGGRTLPPGTVDYNLQDEFTYDQIACSPSFFNHLSIGNITAKDIAGNAITTTTIHTGFPWSQKLYDLVVSGGSTYTHPQLVASDTWVIVHNLGRFPSVMIVDSAGTVVIGDIEYDSANQITLTFMAPFAGKAYLN